MPSAANGKSEKPASSEATDNSPVRQILTIIEHKIRNLEKRKSKLTSYRDLQKAGKELNADQRVAVAKYDEVSQTLEFARDLAKQMASIAVSAEREAKKQAKRDAWVRYASDTSKIREVLLIMDCLVQMGTPEVREDFLNGTNGAAKLTEQDLKILDELYPEVTPKHEEGEAVEGQLGFQAQASKAAEHLYSIIDGKPKEVLGTTYAHIKQIVTTVHECGYFDKSAAPEPEPQPEPEPPSEEPAPAPLPPVPQPYAPAAAPPAAAVPPPAYPLRPLPPITLQEVEHAYFAQQYPPRPLAEVIGSQNFFFLQESELDSPAGTPQPAPALASPGPIPTQTFTNQHFVAIAAPAPPDAAALPLPQPHFAPLPEHAAYAVAPMPAPLPPPAAPAPAPAPAPPAVGNNNHHDEEWKENESPEREDGAERRTQGQGDGQSRYGLNRRYGGGGGRGRGAPNGYRGRGGYQARQGEGYHREHQGGRGGKDYQPRQYSDNYQPRHKEGYSSRGDNYYGNGDSGASETNGRERYGDSYREGGFKSRGRGGPRAPRAAPRPHYRSAKPEQAD
ncbi:hypothetical protein JYU34_009634 [Plutella xylostella]|uniref:Caprin-1 dimerization domain-containing protein n=1 Tax=Plutella xylostella TaxID=51655 RepID=A0ABQ7QLA7_PLUXY|nr:hypothetical protein JYU34_009634 [Plutella xylostella]